MRLKALRELYNLTQKEVSELSEVPIAVVRNYEQGKPVSDENVADLDAFIDDYDRYIEEMDDEIFAFSVLVSDKYQDSAMFYISEKFQTSDLSKEGFVYWRENAKMNDYRKFVILYTEGEFRQRLIVSDLDVANLVAPKLKERFPDSRVKVAMLERNQDYFESTDGPSFRWSAFKAFGEHPKFYDSKTK